ncbi:serologically defined breast cancer antigen 84 [Cryptosporidium ryanae]|uniref:serologically defined breast cancer antigen 84 n=1 Tax=Cryptosporidium ryanae TaxID=515981 RepID=UPI00351A182C|nr:serologically defined breast cancer antigen 84 [Cryptosporidium ryanae]
MNTEFDHLSNLRRRRSSIFVGNLVKANEKLQTHVRNIDIYGKIHDDYCVKSTSKSIISFLLYCIVLILTLNEIWKYYLGEEIDNINVDNNLNNKLDVKMDISFPSLRCEEIFLDTVDNVGENQLDAKDELKKIHINMNGEEVPGSYLNQENNEEICLSCYGAESDKYRCCNTCDKLKSAYRERGWSYLEIVNKSPQCLDKIGCRIIGKIQVNKVSGNFHVALGTATIKSGKHVHEFNMNDISRGFNTSHVIHELTFGTDRIPFVSSPLDKVEKVVRKGTKMFHYYIKLVPTEYIMENGKNFFGNQYTYSEKEKEVYVNKGELSGLPGVFFVYDFQPFVLKRIHQSIPLTHLFTSFCAIVGGIYSVMSILDSILAFVIKKMKENFILFEKIKNEYKKLAFK